MEASPRATSRNDRFRPGVTGREVLPARRDPQVRRGPQDRRDREALPEHRAPLVPCPTVSDRHDAADVDGATGATAPLGTPGSFLSLSCEPSTVEVQRNGYDYWTYAKVTATAPGLGKQYLTEGWASSFHGTEWAFDSEGAWSQAWATSGEVIRLVGRLQIDETGCTASTVTAYIWAYLRIPRRPHRVLPKTGCRTATAGTAWRTVTTCRR